MKCASHRRAYRVVVTWLLALLIAPAIGATTVFAQNIITTVAGGGANSASALSADIAFPTSVAVDSAGNVFIAAAALNQVYKVDPLGNLSLVAGNGTGGFSGDGGPATSASLAFPDGVALDSAGNLYILDSFNQRVRRVNVSTGVITTMAGNGIAGYSGDGGPATSASLNFGGFFADTKGAGVAVDGTGNLFIADAGNNRIRRVDAVTATITTVAGNGTAGYSGDGGPATSASLNFGAVFSDTNGAGVAVDGTGNLFIADAGNQRIRRVDAVTATITTVAGNGTLGYSGDGGPATSASFYDPSGVAVDASGNLFIADRRNEVVRRVNASTGIITTVAGNGTGGFSGDGGPATSATLHSPQGVAVDSSGNFFIADSENNHIRLVAASTGVINSVAGGGTVGDGGAATSALLATPFAVVRDSAGNLFIGDASNFRIRRVDASTSVITTVAGNGTDSFSGDGGPAASAGLKFAGGLAIDSAGNLFVSDNDARVRRVDASTGIITTVAGNGMGGFSGDGGPATSANLAGPWGLAVDSASNLFIADLGNNRIRRVDASTGTITTVAGNGTAGFSGDGGPATSASLNLPTGVAVDSAGNLFIGDSGNNRIREVAAATGTITTVAGNGTAGFGGDGGPGTAASLNLVMTAQMGMDSGGNLFIPDSFNYRIRRLDASTGIITTVAGSGTAGFAGDGGSAKSASLSLAFGVLVDSSGNAFISDTGNNRIRQVALTPGVSLSITGLTFADQAVGTTSPSQTITLTSTGGLPLTITSIVASSNFAQTTTCPISPATLNPGSICTISVTFTPTTPGPLTGNIAITDNENNLPGSLQTVTLNGFGMSNGVVGLSTASLTFPDTVAGTTSAPLPVTLTNTGAGPLGILGFSTSGPFYETNNCPASLAVGASCVISVTFSPYYAQEWAGFVSISTDASSVAQTVSLSGNGIMPVLTFHPTSVSFGIEPVGQTSPAILLTMTNVGTAAANIASVVASAEFGVVSNCGSSLAAGASCTLNVTFTPAAVGSRFGTLTVNSDAPGNPYVVSLSGTGFVMVLSPDYFQFPNQSVGTTSAAATFTVTNTGSAPLTFSSISLSGNTSDFALTNACGSSLAGGASCTVSVTFTPSTFGYRSVSLDVVSNAPDSPQSAGIYGYGIIMSPFPNSLFFDQQALGTTSSARTITLTNTGTTTVTIASISTFSPFAETNNCTSLAPGAACTINVTFTPAYIGYSSQSLVISSDAPDTPAYIQLIGFGYVVGLTPAPLFFGAQTVGTSSAPQTVTLTNASAGAVNISSVTITGDFAQTNTCGSSVAAGASCTFSITFTPTVARPRSGDLTITSDAPDSPHVAHLYGATSIRNLPGFTSNVLPPNDDGSTGIVPIGFLLNFFGSTYSQLFVNNNGDVTFDQALGTYTPFDLTRTLSVIIAPFFGDVDTRNPASGVVHYGQDTVNGHQAFGVDWFDVGYYGGHADKLNTFQLVLVARPDVAPGAFDIELNYAKIQWETGDASSGSGGLGGFSARAGYSNGTALPGTFFELAGSAINGALLDSNTTTGLINNRLGSAPFGQYVFSVRAGAVVPPGLVPSATSLTFPSTPVNQASNPMTVTLTNTGGSTLTISSITATGDFSQTNNCPSSLQPGAGCSVNVVFRPTAAGTRTGTLTVADDAPNSPQTVSLTGTGVVSGVSLSATTLGFGNQLVGVTSAAQSVTVTNSGSTALTVSGVSVTGANPGDFAKTADTCTGASVVPSGTCSVSITFTPAAPGARTATLSIADDASGSPQTVSLTGTGVAPGVSLSTASVNFPGNPLNLTCPTQDITVTNTGTGQLNVSSIVVTGNFSETDTCSEGVAPGASCVISVQFHPAALGTVSGTLSINDNAAGSPQAVALTGTGTPACTVLTSAQAATVLRGTASVDFTISDQKPSCTPDPIQLTCTVDNPATCRLAATTIQPTGSTTLTVGNLEAVGAVPLTVEVVKRSEFRVASVSMQVRVADFRLSAYPPAATVAAGQTASYSITVSPVNGLEGNVQWGCQGAPAGATCTVTPARVTLDGATPAQVSVSVATAARSHNAPRVPPAPPQMPRWVWLLGLATMASLALTNRRRRAALVLATLLLMALVWAACGGGGGRVSTNAPGTPAGSYGLKVTATYTTASGAASNLNHTTNLTLTVN